MRAKSAHELEAKWKRTSFYSDSSRPTDPAENPNLRLRRCLSWLGRAEREADDFDAAFMFLWIVFNAAYGQMGSSSDERTHDRERRREYFDRVIQLENSADGPKAIYDTVYANLMTQIRDILDNEFVYEPYWQFHNGEKKHANWRDDFDSAKRDAAKAIDRGRTERVLREVFDRLYTLRNQLLHGGATWAGSMNREQVKAGATIMAHLVPHFIDVMIDHPRAGWGMPRYPAVRKETHGRLIRLSSGDLPT